jgi:hypothetical protein
VKVLSRFVPAAAVAIAVAAFTAPGALTMLGSVTVPGGAGGEGIAVA